MNHKISESEFDCLFRWCWPPSATWIPL